MFLLELSFECFFNRAKTKLPYRLSNEIKTDAILYQFPPVTIQELAQFSMNIMCNPV